VIKAPLLRFELLESSFDHGRDLSNVIKKAFDGIR
jgi:hypothetical protein